MGNCVIGNDQFIAVIIKYVAHNKVSIAPDLLSHPLFITVRPLLASAGAPTRINLSISPYGTSCHSSNMDMQSIHLQEMVQTVMDKHK